MDIAAGDGLLFGEDHITYVTGCSPERERAFERLARTAEPQEPSRSTLLA